MIFEFLIGTLITLFIWPILLIPALPPLDSTIENSVRSIFPYFTNGFSFVAYLMTPQLLGFIVVSSIAIWQFDNIYSIGLYVIRKMPFINIRE